MQNFSLKSFGVLIPSFLLTLTMNAQSVPASQNEQGAIFKELSYLNQNFNNPVKKRNGFSLVAATNESYGNTAQFVKDADSIRYQWVGDRGIAFDPLSYSGLSDPFSYDGVIFDPPTDASEIRDALYNFDTVAYYRLLLNTNSYGDLYKRKIGTLDANGTISNYSEARLQTNNNWQESIVTSYLFDNQNRLIEVLEKRNLGGTLTNYSKVTYAYTAADKIELITSTLWSAGSWTNSNKYSYAYDSNNNLIDYTVENWQNGNWGKLMRILLEYNSNNKVSSRTTQMGATGNWENSHRWNYNYANNNLTTVAAQDWASGSWTDLSELYEYSYNNLNQCVSKTDHFFYQLDTNVFRMIFNYNAVNEMESIVWQSGGEDREDFNDYERWVFEYSNAGLTGHYSQKKINNTWTFFYGGPNPGDRSFYTHYYYSDTNTTNISGPKQVAFNCSVYPNPASTNLSVAIDKNDIQYIVIKDLFGRAMLSVNYSNKVSKAEVDISRIASGNYILTVGNASEYGVQKISIIK